MVNNVLIIIELQSLSGRTSIYREKKSLLDVEGLELFTKVRKRLYTKNIFQRKIRVVLVLR